MSEVLKLSAPWVNYYREINALFGEDPDVLVQYEEDENIINLRVNGTDKAEAISQLLPEEKEFGNVIVKIKVIPANRVATKVDLFKKAFDGNPIFSYALSIDTGMTTNTFNYVIFKHLISQYYTDSLNDPHGLTAKLYEDIARDVFEDKIDGVMYSTDTKENNGVVELSKKK